MHPGEQFNGSGVIRKKMSFGVEFLRCWMVNQLGAPYVVNITTKNPPRARLAAHARVGRSGEEMKPYMRFVVYQVVLFMWTEGRGEEQRHHVMIIGALGGMTQRGAVHAQIQIRKPARTGLC